MKMILILRPYLAAAALTLGLWTTFEFAQAQDDPAGAASSEALMHMANFGDVADEQATQAWRKRRIIAAAQILIEQGIAISDEELARLINDPAATTDIPELEGKVAALKAGKPTTSLLPVGMLLGGPDESTAYSRCTVTLSKPDKAITARHCLAYPHDDKFWVYFPYGGVREIAENGVDFFCKTGDEGCSATVDDLAILTLEEPYDFLPPAVLGLANTATVPQPATIVGYGISGDDLADYAIKREGDIELATCNYFPPDGLSLCFDYVADFTLSGNQTSTSSGSKTHANCNNDSGGPMLTPSINNEKQIGVASQKVGSCSGGGEGRYVNATDSRYVTWLQSAYCQPFCVPDPNLVLAELLSVPIDNLDASDSMRTQQFVVPHGTASIIVTLNHGRGWFPNPNNLNLQLTASLNASCTQFVEVEVCTADSPVAGTYEATVIRVNGDVEYQLSAVALYSDLIASAGQIVVD